MSDLVVSPEVLEEAEAIVRDCLLPDEYARAVVAKLAQALQRAAVRCELAEMERTQAIATLKSNSEKLLALAKASPVAWVVCQRCGRRAPTKEAIVHDSHCALSSRPPPRLSLVVPKNEEGA